MRIWTSDPSKWLIFGVPGHWWVVAPGEPANREPRGKFPTFEAARAAFAAGRK